MRTQGTIPVAGTITGRWAAEDKARFANSLRSIPIEDFRDGLLALLWAQSSAGPNGQIPISIRRALWRIPGFKSEFYSFAYGGLRDA